MTASPELTVLLNPWALFTFRVTLLVIGPGLAWAWLIPVEQRATGGARIQPYLLAFARTLFMGLAPVLLGAVVLLQVGHFTPVLFSAYVLGITAVGCLFGALRHRAHWGYAIRKSIPGVLMFAAGCMAIMLLPRAGEWIVGGWDPGVYVNNGVAMAREGAANFEGPAVFRFLEPEEFDAYTRTFNEKVYEVFPGVPVDPDTRQYDFYFFPLMSSWVAVLQQSGGLRAATRVNMLTGWMVWLVLPAVVVCLTGKTSWALAALALLTIQPVWLYHLHVPTSEMLHLLLLSGLFFWVPLRQEQVGAVAMIAIYFLAAILNRLSFLPFAGLFVFLLQWVNLSSSVPLGRRVGEWAVYALALCAGLIANVWWASSTMGRVQDVTPWLLGGCAAGLMAALMFLFLSRAPRIETVLRDSHAWTHAAGMGGLFIFFSLLGVGAVPPPLQTASQTFQSVLPFFTPSLLIAGWIGCLWIAVAGSRLSASLRGLLFFLALSGAALFVQRHIASLYPWATRRFMPELALFISLAGSYPLFQFVQMHPFRRRAGAVCLFALLVGIPVLRPAYRAATLTEYDGLAERIAQVAHAIEPDDIVVADHFRWGTPLALIHGLQIVNGERLWAPDEATIRTASKTLHRLAAEGHRILFLTSTPENMDVFPMELRDVELHQAFPVSTYQEFIHHPRAKEYALQTREVVFILYEWRPAAQSFPKTTRGRNGEVFFLERN